MYSSNKQTSNLIVDWKEEQWVDCCIMPEWYQVSDLGRLKRKSIVLNRKRKFISHDWKECYTDNWYSTKENWWGQYQRSNMWYYVCNLRASENNDKKRHVCLLHRLVYCSFNWLDYKMEWDVWHHDDNSNNNVLDNLYLTNQKRNVNNRKLAYKLLDLYKRWHITISDKYINDINVDL